MILDDEDIIYTNLDLVTNWCSTIVDKLFSNCELNDIIDFLNQNNIKIHEDLKNFSWHISSKYTIFFGENVSYNYSTYSLLSIEKVINPNNDKVILIRFKFNNRQLSKFENINYIEIHKMIDFVKNSLKNNYRLSQFTWSDEFLMVEKLKQ